MDRAVSNSKGTSAESSTLDYYDRLPPSVRAAIADARFDWALGGWLRMWNDGRISAADLVQRIREADRAESARSRLKVWGPDYPVLKGEMPTPGAPARRRKRR